MAKPYNGHHCWNCWNVSLWIGNDEGLYRVALECKRRSRSTQRAAILLITELGGDTSKTPDGARYTLTAVRSALAGLE
jgi:hypothetical protein